MTGVAYLQQESIRESAMQKHFAAEQKSLLGHLRMVADITKDYGSSGVETAELIRAGNLGLIHALEHYEPVNAELFSGYAARCIRQHIERFLTSRNHLKAAEPAPMYAASSIRNRHATDAAGKQSSNQGIYVVRAYIESRIGELRRSVHSGIRPSFSGLYD